MNIGIKLNKNFTTAFNKMLAEYGEDMARLNGFADSQLSYTDFIDNFYRKIRLQILPQMVQLM